MEVKKGERRSRVVVAALLDFLTPVVGEDYLRGVVAGIARDVKRDLDETADREFNDSDLRLAIGRVLCARLKGWPLGTRIDYAVTRQ